MQQQQRIIIHCYLNLKKTSFKLESEDCVCIWFVNDIFAFCFFFNKKYFFNLK
jgi:hypothetical protein